jgi:hypothetical protein
MNLHVDRKTQQLGAESRRLWGDVRVWVVNCLAVEAAWTWASAEEVTEARRGRDQMLAAILHAW